ncbi:MAG: hypothetical protein GF370_03790 [Candidatus Nealsonbacteria bacterium]|nr:hypothetical protein [Candidatus Nealsonbacteria bacterium]
MEEISSRLAKGEEEEIPGYEKIKIKCNLALQRLEVVVQNFQTIEHQKGKCAFFPKELGKEVRNKEPNLYI